ncbi:MAG: DUF3379 domain-containing protein, partial [Salinisphaera sp.]|nr:DUF3379 domain-containing protein [Salinisphaera sp.]
MNCLEFRRACLSHPRELDTAQRAHDNDCPVCCRFAAEQRAFDGRLAAALAVPAPERLAERVCFRRGLRARRRLRWLASAAVVALAVGASFGVYLSLPAPMPVRAFIAHMKIDPLQQMPPDP